MSDALSRGLGSLGSALPPVRRRYNNLPYVALTIDDVALQKLTQSPFVVSIQLDRPTKLQLVQGSAMIGAVLILLSCALGLTGYLVEAQIPDRVLAAVQAHIHSPLVFLLVLNIVLLVLGSVLEVFSAIVILTPLVVPLAAAYGIDPVHLGVIFLANLELGFLFPPVGLNLFLSSSRFGKPMISLYRHVLPFLAILGGGVLLITYWPGLSLALTRMLAGP